MLGAPQKGLWTAWALLQVACSPQGFLVAITAAGAAYQVTWSPSNGVRWGDMFKIYTSIAL